MDLPLGDRLPIAPIPSLEPGGIHAGHAPYVQPFREIDGRLGWYASGGVKRSGVIEVRGIYWDNRGDADTFDGYQHAWATHFGNVGVHLYLPGRVELIGQHLWGETQIGSYTSEAPVDAYFRTTYGLASVRFGRHRLSARYDDFRTEDEDPPYIQLLDPLTERGHAWTAAYGLTIADKHRLAIEALSIESNRTVRTLLGLPAHDTNFVVRASLRLVF